MFRTFLAAVFSFLFVISQAEGAGSVPDFKGQLRVFGASSSPNPDDLNTELKAEGIKEVKNALNLGLEISQLLTPWFGVGLRYTQKNAAERSNAYRVYVKHESLAGVARFATTKTDIFKMDLFLGAGLGGGLVEITGTGGPQKWSTEPDKGLYINGYGLAGVGFAFGFKSYFLNIEAGYEYCKIPGIDGVGSSKKNIEQIDMSGPFVGIGILFDNTGK